MSAGMGHSEGDSPGFRFPRCTACDDVIGVYEPLVQVVGGVALRTSLAADPHACRVGGDCYHLDCYEVLGDVS
jgi:hypothetical protein